MSKAPHSPASLTAILETALYATDLDAAQAFYAGVLGLETITRIGNRHVFFRVGGAVLLIFNPHETTAQPRNTALPVPPHGAQGPGHACFAVPGPDIDQWCTHLRNAGVAIEADFHWPHGPRSVYFRDPAGNSIELAEPTLWD